MSDANHPLPWKAVEFRVHGQTVWDITNDAGDESEEYSVTESMDKKTARFIVEACNNHAALKARVAELEVALAPFAQLGKWANHPACLALPDEEEASATVGDCRRAAAVLAKGERDE